jgi:Pentose-5-phosphate-3-epimerase
VKLENISEISEAGADTFVAGSAIFSQNNYEKVISEMRSSIK